MTQNDKAPADLLPANESFQLGSTQSVIPSFIRPARPESKSVQRRGTVFAPSCAPRSTKQPGAQTASFVLQKKIVPALRDPEKDTQAQARLKEAVINALLNEPEQRSKEDLQTLGNFLQRYQFFAKFKKT